MNDEERKTLTQLRNYGHFNDQNTSLTEFSILKLKISIGKQFIKSVDNWNGDTVIRRKLPALFSIAKIYHEVEQDHQQWREKQSQRHAVGDSDDSLFAGNNDKVLAFMKKVNDIYTEEHGNYETKCSSEGTKMSDFELGKRCARAILAMIKARNMNETLDDTTVLNSWLDIDNTNSTQNSDLSTTLSVKIFKEVRFKEASTQHR